MHIGKARYAACGRHWTDKSAAPALFILPPDVEPPPERTIDAPLRWLAARHMAACDRAAACKGLSIGDAVGEVLATLVKALERRLPAPAQAVAATSDHRSLPRIRRSQFHRRARALQFRPISVR